MAEEALLTVSEGLGIGLYLHKTLHPPNLWCICGSEEHPGVAEEALLTLSDVLTGSPPTARVLVAAEREGAALFQRYLRTCGIAGRQVLRSLTPDMDRALSSFSAYLHEASRIVVGHVDRIMASSLGAPMAPHGNDALFAAAGSFEGSL